MKIECINGYYKFYPHNHLDLRRFELATGVKLVRKDDYLTFAGLADLPAYSFAGHFYGGLYGLVAIKNYAGQSAADVMQANGVVFSLALQRLVPIASILELAELNDAAATYSSPELLQAGALQLDGKRIKSFSALVDTSVMKYNYFDILAAYEII